MDQGELRRLESQCIQEEPPRCTSACPLHLDGRKLCELVAKGSVNEAWAVLVKTLPLPRAFARACDAPCKSACLRAERGGPLELAALEAFVAGAATKEPRRMPFPKKAQRMAVFGGGLAGLTAASDLARKGFGVTLHTNRPGGQLLDLPEARLPRELLEKELEALKALGVSFAPLDDSPEAVAAAMADVDAAFLDGQEASRACTALGPGDDLTLGTATLGLFLADPEPSIAMAAGKGRRAATSMERYLQKASLAHGRERDLPYVSRLFTDISGVEPLAPAPVPPAEEGGYDDAQARAEAARCLSCECLECVKRCVYLERFGSYPKVYARQIHNNDAIVMGTRMANKLINSCMLCGLCEVVCPEDFAVQDMCLEARRRLVGAGHMPASAHEFALRDMAFANAGKCRLAMPAPGVDSCARVFFPGCQFTASDPGLASRAYAHLREAHPDTGLLLACCGAPARWAGREDLFLESSAALRADWEALGRPEVVAACPTCVKMLREVLAEGAVTSLWELLDEGGEGSVRAVGEGASLAQPLALHDPCGTREDAALRGAVRGLLGKAGVALAEPELTGERTECCGFGGLVSEANPPLAGEAAERRASRMEGDWVTYCAMCRDMLSKTGRSVVHALDLLLPGEPGSAAQAGKRPAPGYSARRENRARLRETLLRELWPDSAPGLAAAAEPWEEVRVRLTEQAAANMEERRILVGDVQKTLLRARQSGHAFKNDATGRLLSKHRPVSVTYWVEYEPDGDGYLVHNAWCHRMHILGGQS
jgi:Fe-S oxidoreductase